MDFDILKNSFTKESASQLNSLVLAYIGDAVYEVFVRSHLINENRNTLVNKLHKEATNYVKAEAQSNFIHGIFSELTEEEVAVYKRGRNTKSYTKPKNAEVKHYRNATGFEALVGYLYLSEQMERLNYLLKKLIAETK
ncbi:Mini-ribonuclease 3 [Clostridium cellulovorans]|uniref:Mini-ribonuclease 3 n=1 Tax=Clostridium cellulovorans (strain ATCC 35296 / DSM 3052 / OCM 3 / 743B) TaxID=573061 RepID=D9SXC0_CLOC7|nr:ribonuclease III domain-containing protein [Clostridium cellulovorans]ADL53423.1 ribonuclease III [Clostridium cellulovorans 743B]